MKYLLFSDLHGSLKQLNKIIKVFNDDQFDKIIFLGDLLYHGPRNNLPEDYNPKLVANVIKEYKDKIIFIKGNCDAEVDEMVIEAKSPFKKKHVIKNRNKRFIFTHGHHLSRFEPNYIYGTNDYVFYGHYHVFDYCKINGAAYINIGSITLPKDNIFGYAVLDEKSIKFIDDNNIIFKQINFDE